MAGWSLASGVALSDRGEVSYPDALIRELIADPERPATVEEVAKILEHVARAPFNTRMTDVPAELVGLEFLGEELRVREDSLTAHMAQRVLRDDQWSVTTTKEEFLEDIRQAILHPEAALAVYETRRTHYAAVVAPNVVPRSRLGRQPGRFVVIPYSANRGRIVSTWQARDEANLLVPERACWIKPLKRPRNSGS